MITDAFEVRALCYECPDLILDPNELSLQDNEKKLLDYKYVVFVDQAYNTYPVSAHYEPIDNDLNYIVEQILGY